jgi:hypothetical protein
MQQCDRPAKPLNQAIQLSSGRLASDVSWNLFRALQGAEIDCEDHDDAPQCQDELVDSLLRRGASE